MNKINKMSVVAGITTAIFGLSVIAGPAVSAATIENLVEWGVGTSEYNNETKVGTITLTGDIEQDLVIENGQTVTLNLNGHTLTNYTPACETIYVKAGGTLVIEGEGVSTITQKDGSVNTVIRNEGTLTINGGEIVETNTGAGFSPAIANSGTMTINEGVTVQQAGDFYAIQTMNGGSTTINGGHFSSASNNTALIGDHDGTGNTTVINGGEFVTDHYAVLSYPGNTTTINDGDFEGDMWVDDGGTLTINYATVDGNIEAEEGATVTIYDGEFTGYVSEFLVPYEVTDGDGQTWSPDSEGGLTIRIDAPFAEYSGFVIINKTKYDAWVAAGSPMLSMEEAAELYYEEWFDNLHEGVDYTVSEGSTIITISRDFLATLSAGEYEYEVIFSSAAGFRTTLGSFTIAGEADTVDTPDTGVMATEKSSAAVNTGAMALVASALTTLAGAAVVARRQARK